MSFGKGLLFPGSGLLALALVSCTSPSPLALQTPGPALRILLTPNLSLDQHLPPDLAPHCQTYTQGTIGEYPIDARENLKTLLTSKTLKERSLVKPELAGFEKLDPLSSEGAIFRFSGSKGEIELEIYNDLSSLKARLHTLSKTDPLLATSSQKWVIGSFRKTMGLKQGKRDELEPLIRQFKYSHLINRWKEDESGWYFWLNKTEAIYRIRLALEFKKLGRALDVYLKEGQKSFYYARTYRTGLPYGDSLLWSDEKTLPALDRSATSQSADLIVLKEDLGQSIQASLQRVPFWVCKGSSDGPQYQDLPTAFFELLSGV